MTIQRIKISDLTLLEKNPRKITKEAMDKLVKSLKDDPGFFDRRPCLVNETKDSLIVYAGNQRVRAAKKLKWDSVPCIIDKDLDESIMKDRIIKDNKTYGEFDFEMLANEFDIEKLLDAGFSPEELHIDIEDLECTDEEEGELLEPPKDPKTKLGDLYELGSHRLKCGDSTNPDDVVALLADAIPILMVTDPPYGIKMDRGFSGSDGFSGKGMPIKRKKYDKKWDDERPSFKTFEYLIAHCVNAIIFGGNFFADLLPQSKHWLVWDKKNTMPTFGDCELAWTNFDRKSVKKYEVEWNGLIGKEDQRDHPTQKPVKLMLNIIQDYIKDDQAILDPFLGSGTTLIACEKLNRKCYGMELDPAYCDIIVNRWIKLTGKKVKRNGEEIDLL